MIDFLVLAVLAAIDVESARAAKKHCWVRIVNLLFSLLFLAAIVGLIYITFKYS